MDSIPKKGPLCITTISLEANMSFLQEPIIPITNNFDWYTELSDFIVIKQ